MSMSIEFKYSLRMLLKKPVFTALTILIVAIGLGLTVYAFSLLNNLVFKPLYLNGEQEIVAVEGQFDHNHLYRAGVDPYHVNQAAQKLDLTEERVRELINLRQIRATKIGKWRISPDDLESFIKSRFNIKK